MDALVIYFNSDGYAQFGFDGDCKMENPEQCAIRNLREFARLLRTKAGNEAYTAMLNQDLIDKGLIPPAPKAVRVRRVRR